MRQLLCFFTLFCTCVLAAQSSPRATISAVFGAMAAGDTTGLRAYFHPQATLHSVVTKADGTTMLEAGNLTRWFAGIQGADAGAWVEKTHYTSVRTDGDLATAWAPYNFIYKGRLNHCGVNTFQMVKDGAAGQWRVLHLTDTHRDGPGDCTPVSEQSPEDAINALADAWHLGAAEADSLAFFGRMADDAIYIGTDKTEHWDMPAYHAFADKYFARGKAWDFTATERHVFYDEDYDLAYWDEMLHTWMGPCRGTAVVRRDGVNGWKIVHYTLSMTIPNEKVFEVMEAADEPRKPR